MARRPHWKAISSFPRSFAFVADEHHRPHVAAPNRRRWLANAALRAISLRRSGLSLALRASLAARDHARRCSRTIRSAAFFKAA